MDDINLLLERIRSTDQDARLMASKQLRAAPNLPEEAINVLMLASLDSDPTVSRTARFTLLVHKIKKRSWVLLLVIGVLFFIWILSGIGKTTRLTC